METSPTEFSSFRMWSCPQALDMQLLQLPWRLLRSCISFPELLMTILAPICFSVIIMEKWNLHQYRQYIIPLQFYLGNKVLTLMFIRASHKVILMYTMFLKNTIVVTLSVVMILFPQMLIYWWVCFCVWPLMSISFSLQFYSWGDFI